MKKLLIASAAIAIAATSFAHDTWLMPDRFQVAPGEFVTLDLTSGMEFPKLESGANRERVQGAKVRLATRTFDMTEISQGPKSLIFKTALPDPGVAALWVKLPLRSIELKPEEVEHYLEEIDPPAAVRKAWADADPKRWRESYTKHQKTYVRVGNPASDGSWSEPLGIYLEIVPEKDPTALRVGDEFPVRVLKNSAPLPDFALNAVAAGAGKGETKRTDAEGRVVFRLDKPGAWLLRGTDLRRSSNRVVDWESDFTTLTIEVR